MDLKNEVKAKILARDNSWKEFVKENGSEKIKDAFVELVVSSLREGKSPISKEVLKSIIFDGATITEADIFMRLK